MTHFSKEKWIDFKNNIVTEEEEISMEDHLFTCDTCLDLYLKLIDHEEIDFAQMMISSDFTESVMQKVNKVAPISKTIRKKKKRIMEDIFMYYIAAASVVLVLTAGGVFTKMASLPIDKIGVDRFKTQESIGNIHGFTAKITDNTNSFINNFGSKKKEGGN